MAEHMNYQQKVIFRQSDNYQYGNFFWTPGSIDSLDSLINEGWKILFIKDSPYLEKVICILERGEK